MGFYDGETEQELWIPIDGDWVTIGNHWLRATSDRSSRGTSMVLIEWSGWDDARQQSVLLQGAHFLWVDPEVESDVHVWLERSYHVATLDYDYPEILEGTAAFAQRVAGVTA